MSRHDQITAAANQRVRTWESVSRAELLERLNTKPVVKPLNHGFSVDLPGEPYPVWLADRSAVGRLLDRRAALAAELAES